MNIMPAPSQAGRGQNEPLSHSFEDAEASASDFANLLAARPADSVLSKPTLVPFEVGRTTTPLERLAEASESRAKRFAKRHADLVRRPSLEAGFQLVTDAHVVGSEMRKMTLVLGKVTQAVNQLVQQQ